MRHGAVRMCAPQREMSGEVKELRSLLKKCSVYLVGPMGSGKSAVGQYLARELNFRYLDTDELIEAVAGKPISEIFAESGEEAFRDLETVVLDQVAPFIACIVSTGGGVVLRRENWGRLQTGIVVHLDAPVDVLHDRLQGSETAKRPLLNDAESLRDRIQRIVDERKDMYHQADVNMPIKADMAVDHIGKEIVRILTNFIKSNPPKMASLYPGDMKGKGGGKGFGGAKPAGD